jgi:hypothetical protein
MSKTIKYTVEKLTEAVLKNHSIAGVLRFFGLREAGGTHSYITQRIKQLGIDTSHFTGIASNRGENHKGGSEKIPPEKILIKRSNGRRQVAMRLRRALIESGIEYKCVTCNLTDNWCTKELRLQVNHKNRNWLDDRIDNLEFLCPNCHSQTEGWSGNQGGTSLTSAAESSRKARIRIAAKNGRNIKIKTPRPKQTPKPRPRKGTWPDKDNLQQMIETTPATKIAKIVGVSGVAVKAMCKRLGIETKPPGYWSKKQALDKKAA